MANPQLGNGYVGIANEIWDEIIRRDFSKRQKDILLFILRLSYGCNKKTALIPKLKYFVLCGIGPTHIKKELTDLQKRNVIDWDRETMVFSFQKDYERWNLSSVRDWDKAQFNELLAVNLKPKNLPKQEVTKKGSYQKGNKKLTKKVSIKLPKREVRHVPNPWRSKEKWLSKDIIKEKLGYEPIALSYPFGDYSRNTMKLAQEAGFKMAFGINNKRIKIGDDLYSLKRITVNGNLTGEELIDEIENKFFWETTNK